MHAELRNYLNDLGVTMIGYEAEPADIVDSIVVRTTDYINRLKAKGEKK